MGDADPYLVPGCRPQVGRGGCRAPVGTVPHCCLERPRHTGHHHSGVEVGGWGPAGWPVLRWQPKCGCPGNPCLPTSPCLPCCWGCILGGWVRCPHQHQGAPEPGPAQGPKALSSRHEDWCVRGLLHTPQCCAPVTAGVRDCAAEDVGECHRSEPRCTDAKFCCLSSQVPDDIHSWHRLHLLGHDSEDLCCLAQVLCQLQLQEKCKERV